MNSLTQSDIFFFVSSIGFAIIAILVAIFVFYCIKAITTLAKILKKTESNLDSIGDTTMELIDDMRNNIFFRMLFKSKKKTQAREHKKN